MSVIWSPVRALESAASNRRVLAGLTVTVVYAALSVVGAVVVVLGGATEQQLRQPGVNLPPDMLEDVLLATEIGTVVLSALGPFLWWVGVSLLMQLATRLFGGGGPLPAMLAAVGVASVPLALGSLFGIITGATQAALGFESPVAGAVGLLGAALTFGFLIWHVVLVVIGASKARNVGYGPSAGSCAISCAGCATLIIVVGITLGVVVAAIAGSTAP